MNIIERVKALELPPAQYAVFGSAWLDYYNLREAADLDILVTPRLYRSLKNERHWPEYRANGFMAIQWQDACLSSEQYVATDGDYMPDRLLLIAEAVMVEGVPFVQVEEVIKCKQAYNRPKDQADIRMLMDYLGVR